MKKMLFATAALAVVIASPAFAASGRHVQAAPYGAWQAAPFGAYAQSPQGAYAQSPQGGFVSRDTGLGGDYVGTDPDPNIRLQLLKDAQQRE